jgi:hypothetical protein
MQQKHIVSLMQDGYTTVAVRFHPDNEPVDVNVADYTTNSTAQPWHGNAREIPEDWLRNPYDPRIPQQAPPMPGNVGVKRPANYNEGALPRLYTYKVKLSDNAKVGDTAVVMVARGLIMVSIVEVHDVPKIDLDAKFDYKWLVQIIDMAAYNSLLQKEENFKILLQNIERKKQVAAIKNEVLDMYKDDETAHKQLMEAVQSLSIAGPEAGTQNAI